MRRPLAFAFSAAVASAVAGSAPATAPSTALHARVVGVDAGDVLQVRLASGRLASVRLLGLDAPARGECFGAVAAAETRSLARGRRVTLVSSTHIRRGGLRAYVALPSGNDLGRMLLARGAAQIDAWGAPFARFASYVPVQRRAELAARGIWRACAADVDVFLSPSSQTVAVGEELSYTVIVTNSGPLPARRVSVDLRPPASVKVVESRSNDGTCAADSWHVTCSLGSLADGGRATATVVVETTVAGVLSTRASVQFGWCLRAPCGRAPLHDPNRRNDESAALTVAGASPPPPSPGSPPAPPGSPAAACHPSYPTVCIPPPPPDLDCADMPHRDFYVLRDPPDVDPHILDRNEDGIGCQFDDY